MKKTLKLAAAASVIAVPAYADIVPVVHSTLNNMENPLYLPTKHTFYSKLSNGLMLKVADDSKAHKLKNHDGEIEFPIIRIQEELGFGITDRWAVHGSVQYTHNDDIGRTGLSAGRLGTTYRLLNTHNGFVWDMYGDLHLGGIGEMRGQYNISGLNQQNPLASNPVGIFDYDNYSNGMWGFHVGTKFGKTWNRLTTSAFVEVLRTFGDDNTRIRVVGADQPSKLVLAGINAPSEISVEMKSTTEVNAGANVFYQWTDSWSSGLWFKYNHHADQGVEKITTKMPNVQAAMIAAGLEQKLENLKDGFDEYIVGLSVANQLTEHAQIALYGEYTFDTAHKMSQNGTDAKVEAGVRLNFRF